MDDRKLDCMVGGRGLVVGNYCHDVLFRDGVLLERTLGGSSSFIASVLDGLSIVADYIAKVGSDFSYSAVHSPIVSPSRATTVFHAFFTSKRGSCDHRILKRVDCCEKIAPLDFPEGRFGFGLAVGVGGEITPEALEKMLDVCDVVFVDIQSLIRVFHPSDGAVQLIPLKDSGFFNLLPRISFLKASEEESPYIDIEMVRQLCCVVVTRGKNGCAVYLADQELMIPPFPAIQVDPTGAGDSFLAAFVSGLVLGLSVHDASLLGNFFGALTVAQIGLPRFDPCLLQKVEEVVIRRRVQRLGGDGDDDEDSEHEQFHASLLAVRVLCDQACECNGRPSSVTMDLKQYFQLNSQPQEIHSTLH